MWLKNEFAFLKWMLPRIFWPKGSSKLYVFFKILNLLVITLFLLSFVSLLLHHRTNAPLSLTASEPQPFSDQTTMLAVNHRLYACSEPFAAVNVYDESGTFLFCVQAGPDSANGRASFYVYGTDIYIETRMHQLYRFDEDGTYCGRADTHYLYDSSDQIVMPLSLKGREIVIVPTSLYFDDEVFFYRLWDDKAEDHLIFCGDPNSHITVILSTDVVTNIKWNSISNHILCPDRSAMSADGTAYVSRMNKLYRIVNGERQLFAETPFHLYYRYSPTASWMTTVPFVVLLLIQNRLRDYVSKREKQMRTCSNSSKP